ncbi:MAG: CDP-alcohol phosphatidyltransferase family protein [Anaerolineales bacterium]|nr:CDP-alcohol phosphatidyltransferase family protein [Anaerolineales bacterium]MCB8961818.1 CDP-alcohol phosphatidyltransferase family protein [Ardenticatenales bacterium]
MFDDLMRRFKEFMLLPLARLFVRVPPASLTLVSLLFGLVTAVLAWQQLYWWAVLGWSLNRIFDGLDGVVARLSGNQSDFGGYLDIVLDFVIYAAVPIGLVAGEPNEQRWLLLALLLGSFYVNGVSWTYLAAILEKRQHGAAARAEETTITMPNGIVGGFLTIVFFYAFLILPFWLDYLFVLMSGLVLLGVIQRLFWARRHLD